MIHQFNHDFARAKYWISLADGRRELLGRESDTGQKLSYQEFRLVHRRIAASTNERTMIAAVLPPDRFCGDTAQTVRNILPRNVTVLLCGILNSFVVDW